MSQQLHLCLETESIEHVMQILDVSQDVDADVS